MSETRTRTKRRSQSVSVAVEGTERKVSPKQARSRLRFRADIEGLRGLAILGPVLGHFIGDASEGSLSAWTFRLVTTVDIFFVISGFLLTSLLIQDYEMSRKARLKRIRKRSRKESSPSASASASTQAPAEPDIDPGDSTSGSGEHGTPTAAAEAERQDGPDAPKEVRLSSRKLGSIHVLDFYERRGRRLLPAALFVNACTLVIAWLLFNETRFVETQAHALWSALQVENLYLITQATDYFARGGAESPFIHYWTLAITEQFSLLWPLVILAATRTLRFSEWLRKGGNWWIPVMVVTALIAIPSLIVSVVDSIENPAGAYLSTFNRMWIILIGATAALIPRLRKGFGPIGAKRASWAGVALIALSLVVTSKGTPYPGIAAILPAVGTALLMLAGVRGRADTGVTSLLETKSVRFTGRLAYPLYLWHQPIIIFGLILMPRSDVNGFARILVLVPITVAISWLTHKYIEMPFHNVRKLKSEATDRKGRWIGTPRQASQLAGLAFVAVATMSVLGLWARPTVAAKPTDVGKAQMAWAMWDPAKRQPGNLDDDRAGSASRAIREVGIAEWSRAVDRAAAEQTASRADIRGAAALAGRPETTCFDIVTPTDAGACAGPGSAPDNTPWPKGASRNAVMIGNSMTSQWTGTVGSLLPGNVTLTPLTLSSCDPTASPDDHSKTEIQGFDCGAHVTMVDRELKRLRPALAVIGFTPMTRGGEGTGPVLARWGALAQRLRSNGTRVLMIGTPPLLPTLAECLPRDGTDVSACNRTTRPELFAFDSAAKSSFPASGATYMSLVDALCRGEVCPELVSGVPTRLADGGHLSASAVWGLRSLLRREIDRALTQP